MFSGCIPLYRAFISTKVQWTQAGFQCHAYYCSDSVLCWSRGLRLGAKSRSCRVCHRFYCHSTYIHCFDDHSSWFAGYFYLFTYPGLQAHGASAMSIQIHAVAGIPPLCNLLGECLLWMYPLPLLVSICNTIAYLSSQKRKPRQVQIFSHGTSLA